MNGLTREAIEGLNSPLARVVEVHEEVGSTQDRARELALSGTPHGTLVVSKVQIGGLGRLGRRWNSPPGGLWMSMVLRPDLPVDKATGITPAAPVGVAKALRDLGVEARIKWPNDLLVGGTLPDGRKICGILAQSSVFPPVNGGDETTRRPSFVVLGVGLNANLHPEDLGVTDRTVTTLRRELGHDVDLLELLNLLLSSLARELGRLKDLGDVLEDWRAFDCTLGERVRVRRLRETLEGTALDLGPAGSLLLPPPRGVVELFEGEVEGLRGEAYR